MGALAGVTVIQQIIRCGLHSRKPQRHRTKPHEALGFISTHFPFCFRAHASFQGGFYCERPRPPLPVAEPLLSLMQFVFLGLFCGMFDICLQLLLTAAGPQPTLCTPCSTGGRSHKWMRYTAGNSQVEIFETPNENYMFRRHLLTLKAQMNRNVLHSPPAMFHQAATCRRFTV